MLQRWNLLSRGLLAVLLVSCSSLIYAQANPSSASQSGPAPTASPAPTIDVPGPDQVQPAAGGPSSASAQSAKTASSGSSSSDVPSPEKKIYTVPAGTKVLLELRNAINTKSAKPGDGIYLSSTFPVVVGNRVMIPTGVYVQGVVDRVQRGGRIAGKAQLDMHFTSIIFPNGSVAEIPGVVDSVPGSKNQSVKNDEEGTIEQNGDKGRNAGRTAEIALPSGAGVGSIAGAASGHPIEGGLVGLAAGAATVGIVSLFTRNADVQIPTGAQVEMVLQRPLLLEDANLAGIIQPGTAPALIPVAGQPKSISRFRPQILCPPESLGCQ